MRRGPALRLLALCGPAPAGASLVVTSVRPSRFPVRPLVGTYGRAGFTYPEPLTVERLCATRPR